MLSYLSSLRISFTNTPRGQCIGKIQSGVISILDVEGNFIRKSLLPTNHRINIRKLNKFNFFTLNGDER